MRILHVIASLSPRSGGPTTMLKALAMAQARQGMEVEICTSNVDNPSGLLQVITDQPVISDQVTSWYFSVKYLPQVVFSPYAAKLLPKIISNSDIVHIHGLYRFPTTYAGWWARKKMVPYIIRPHGSLDPFLYKQSRHNLILKRIYERLFDFPNLNHASAIHYTTIEEAKRTDFLALSAKTIIVPNGIDWDNYMHLPAKGFFRKKLAIDGQTPLVLFLGRINFKKGLDLLVQAFSRLPKKNCDARLVIAGPDNENYRTNVRQWCREKGIEDKTFFLDYLDSEEVKQAYIDANVFVLPSYTENFGIAVIEAMACGCPVVISDQVNIWREVRSSGAGLVTELDPSALAEAIIHIVKDKNGAHKMGMLGRSAVKKNFTWPNIVDQLNQIYQSLIDERNVTTCMRN